MQNISEKNIYIHRKLKKRVTNDSLRIQAFFLFVFLISLTFWTRAVLELKTRIVADASLMQLPCISNVSGKASRRC